MGDVVAMLTPGRPKKKALHARRSRYMNRKSGRATFSNGVPEQIQGFTTEGEAARWIRTSQRYVFMLEA
jgi:hypothetical protein